MGNSVEITTSGTITGQFDYTEPDGTITTFYGWTFGVIVNGEAGVYTVYLDGNDASAEAAAAADAVQDLEEDPGALGGIAGNDQGSDQGDFADGFDGPDGGDDDDGGDGAVADGGGGEVGESV